MKLHSDYYISGNENPPIAIKNQFAERTDKFLFVFQIHDHKDYHHENAIFLPDKQVVSLTQQPDVEYVFI
jgi:hypothetical protein